MELLHPIRRFLNDLEAAQSRLADVLDRKRTALVGLHVDVLETLAAEENDCVARLQKLLTRRQNLLEQAGTAGLSDGSLRTAIAELSGVESPGLLERVDSLQHGSDRLRRETWVQWIVIRSALTHFTELRELIAGCGENTPTYSRDPSTQATSGGAILNAEI